MIVAAFRELTNEGRTRLQTLVYVGIPLALVVLVASFFTEKAADDDHGDPFDPPAGGYPMPVLTDPAATATLEVSRD
jgi:hypothetical protein